MSIHLDGAIKEAYIGRFKLDGIYIGEKELYSSGFKPEPYLPNEYFYFKLDDKSTSAEVGFEELMTGQTTGSATITYDKTKFTNYSTPIFQYSFDKITWNSYTLGTLITLDNIHNKVYFRGNNSSPWFDAYQTTYSETSGSSTYTRYETHWITVHALIQNAQVRSGGNLLSLRNSTLNNITTIPCNYCFSGLFNGCTNLLTPPVLSATNLKPHCYGGTQKMQTSSDTSFHQKSQGLFSGCTNLQYAPTLPATTLTEYCYDHMFQNCTIMKSPPTLPATTLADYCYSYMFASTNFTTSPELPVTTLTDYCYYGMFFGSNIIEPPQLPATTLASHCYDHMFSASKIIKPPQLSAMTLADYCYSHMFSSTIFTTPPELPATTLADYCYYNMFSSSKITEPPRLSATTLAPHCYDSMFGYTIFTNPPQLPATTLADYCYYSMFNHNTKITIAPDLPALTMKSYCYDMMFWGCENLTTPPALPATTLADHCYGDWIFGMFMGCKSLTKIPKLNVLTLPDECYAGMFQEGVRASSTQTSTCPYPYRVPTTGTGTAGSKSLTSMFANEDDSGDYTPSINTTFYISVPSF